MDSGEPMDKRPLDSSETGSAPNGGPLQSAANSTIGNLGWRGWLVLLALALANFLIVAILYRSFYLGE